MSFEKPTVVLFYKPVLLPIFVAITLILAFASKRRADTLSGQRCPQLGDSTLKRDGQLVHNGFDALAIEKD